MLTTSIEAKEIRDTTTADIKGAYLHAEQDDFTLIKFAAEQVEVMFLIDESCLDCVV